MIDGDIEAAVRRVVELWAVRHRLPPAAVDEAIAVERELVLALDHLRALLRREGQRLAGRREAA